MIYHTETALHTLLDSLPKGERVKTTWEVDKIEVTAEEPVFVIGRHCSSYRHIRSASGEISPSLASLEVTRDEEVSVTRDDEKALHALLDSLEDGETITAEWRNRDGSMTLTGPAQASGLHREVDGYHYGALRLHSGQLHPALHSVTVRRPVVQRWERDGDE